MKKLLNNNNKEKNNFKTKKMPLFENEGLMKSVSCSNQDEVLKGFGLTHFGLTNDEYEERIEKYGKNELSKNKFNWIKEATKAFLSPFNIILLVISIFNFLTYFTNNFTFEYNSDKDIADLLGAIIVATMVIVSGLVGLIQSAKSFYVTKKIGAIVESKTNVIRHKNDDDIEDFKELNKENILELIRLGEELPSNQVVPGDLIYLSSGDMIPADLRIIQSNDLFINQSSLTGESLPVEKHAKTESSNNILDLQNICWTGTSVVSGSAIAIAVTTATRTYFSTISKTITEKRPEGSFSKGIKQVTRVLLIFMFLMVPIVYVLNGLISSTHEWDQSSWTNNPWFVALFYAIAIAVGLTPEMMPMIVTTNLSKGASKMAKQKVLVKQLDAIQSLGAIDILCTDKTGTLTNDKIELIEYLTLDKKTDSKLIEMLYLNSYFQTGLKNPMDKAIIDYVQQNNINFSTHNKWSKLDEIPFDFNRRKLTIVVESREAEKEKVMITKGSIEETLESCTKIFYQDKVIDITESIKRQIISYYENVNSQGKRLLGIAYKNILDDQKVFKEEDEKDLIFFGFASFLDTPKPSTMKIIKLLYKYGVDLKILTGDNEPVTRAICKMVKLQIKGLVNGEQIENATDEELKLIVERNNIFVKLNPLQKAKIIKILQGNGHIVGYMGDGINDAPVLRQSDVAISVNNATDIAKDASDIILLEKSLLVLEKGIIQGRTVFGNILKYIKITIASNFGNVISVIVAAAWLQFQPMTPIQLLFQNLLYDLTQFTLALDRVDEDFIATPQRWDAKALIPFTLINGPTSSIFDIITFAIMGYAFSVNTTTGGDMKIIDAIHANNGAECDALRIFNAGWFLEGILSQALVVQIYRTKAMPFIGKNKSTYPVFISMGVLTVSAFVLVFTPLGEYLKMKSPEAIYASIVVNVLLVYLILSELVKRLYIKWFKRWL